MLYDLISSTEWLNQVYSHLRALSVLPFLGEAYSCSLDILLKWAGVGVQVLYSTYFNTTLIGVLGCFSILLGLF